MVDRTFKMKLEYSLKFSNTKSMLKINLFFCKSGEIQYR
jgi:hypothetical protein